MLSVGCAPERLLWIDDDVSTLESGARVLVTAGFAVDVAASGMEALSLLRQNAYRGVILDLLLPDCSGIDLLRAIRAHGLPLPVSILSGYGTPQDGVAAARLGIVEFWEKPAVGDDLVLLATHLHSAHRDVLALDGLLAVLGRIERSLADSGAVGGSWVALGALLEALLSPRLAILDWVVVCRAVTAYWNGTSASAVLDAGIRSRSALDPSSRAALDRLDLIVRDGKCARLGELASLLRIPTRELRRLVKDTTKANFAALRTACAVRPCVPAVVNTDEHVAQIAYAAGYAHPTQFDRDFRRLFSLSPSELRSRIRAASCGCSGSACGGCTIEMGGCESCTTNCANCEVFGIGCEWTSWQCID